MDRKIDFQHILYDTVVQNIVTIAENFSIQAVLHRNEGHDPITSAALDIAIRETHQYERSFHAEFAQHIAEIYKDYPLNFQVKTYCQQWLKECDLNAKRHKYRTNYLADKLHTEENMILLISNSYLMGFYKEMYEHVLEYLSIEYPELFNSSEKC